jgi:Leucine-rich repeat (LRR) protein
LKYLPKQFIDESGELIFIDLSANQLISIGSQVFYGKVKESIEMIDLNSNYILDIDIETFQTMPKLTTLNLSHQPICFFEAHKICSKIPQCVC